MGPFTTREVATAIWLLAFGLWVGRKASVRTSFFQLVRTALHRKIIVPFLIFMAYMVGTVVALRALGLWDVGLLKDTILWSAMGGLGIAFGSVPSTDDATPLRYVLKKQLGILIIFEFLVNSYTFTLPVELILVPSIVLLTIVQVVAEHREDIASAGKAAKALQAVIGMIMLGFVGARVLVDFGTISWPDTLQAMALPVALTVAVLPVAYVFAVLARYEMLFLRVGFGAELEQGVRWRARWRLMRKLRGRTTEIDKYMRKNGMDLMRVRSRADLDEILPPGVGEHRAA